VSPEIINRCAEIDALPAEWELLKQVRPDLERWKAELRANAHKRLEKGAAGNMPPLTPGQVLILHFNDSSTSFQSQNDFLDCHD
jgi:hypothetical protein